MTPTEPDFYWYKEEGPKTRWEPAEVLDFGFPAGLSVYLFGCGTWFFVSDLKGEWGEKIERVEK
jgi:hypothetical protein